MTRLLDYEDVEIPMRQVSAPHLVEAEEMVAFARVWDPLPMHVDPATPGGLIAPGVFSIALRIRLVHTLPTKMNVIVGLGLDEVRFRLPVRPGDRLRLVHEAVEKRLSASRPDRGLIFFSDALINQDDQPVLTLKDAVLARRRAG